MTTKEIQKKLNWLGYDAGATDGIIGEQTKAAIRDFQKNKFVTGLADYQTCKALRNAAKRLSPREKQTLLKSKGYYLGAVDGLYGSASQKAEKDFRLAEGLDAHANLKAALAKPGYTGTSNDFLHPGQYYDSAHPKRQIVIHHTAGGPSAEATKDWWNMHPNKVATHFVVDGNGQVICTIPKGYWAWHIGHSFSRSDLEKHSIGIEICSYGYLKKKGQVFYNAYGGQVNNVCTLPEPYRGHTYFENYTDAQFSALDKLLRTLIKEYEIPVNKEAFKTGEGGIFELMPEAINGQPGVYAHGAYVRGKTDAYPNPKLLSLLNSL